MDKYTDYVKKFDTFAREKFRDYERAQSAYERAERASQRYPINNDLGVSIQYQLEAQRRDIEYQQEAFKWKDTQYKFKEKTLEEAKAIRSELIETIKKDLRISWEDAEEYESVQMIDELIEALTECINDTSMISYWGQLTKSIITRIEV